ncbi:hypothetical protein SETIT_2G326200v2 [Setaria italica]|uniref:MATH domain-containing protein n=1 Tax=Setaria italica TaxID=4555 RepID=K4A2T6_SETIT|nr:BTB/POZ and MATH domain-containing protein 2 [Setaria italica]RCV13171.1 hypothetical protein SETIT_2G326200v2 [Setaria italica]
MSPTGISVSTVAAAVSATETHMLKIEGYKRLEDMHCTGKFLESSRFQVAGHAWKIHFYPNGDFRENAGFVSLYLNLDDDAAVPAKDVRAEVTFSLVRRPGAPASLLPPHSESFTITYNRAKAVTRRGVAKFIAKQKLDWFSGYLRDDCVAVRCDITVVEKSAAKEGEAVQERDVEVLGLACHCKDELCKRHHARVVGLGLRQAFVKFFLRCFQV